MKFDGLHLAQSHRDRQSALQTGVRVRLTGAALPGLGQRPGNHRFEFADAGCIDRLWHEVDVLEQRPMRYAMIWLLIVAVRGWQPLDQDEDSPEAGSENLSRSERKRRAEALQKLGVRLTGLRPARLESLQLPP